MKKFVVLALGLTLLAAACNKNDNDRSQSTETKDQTAVDQPTPTPTPAPTENKNKPVEIDITAAGFTPADITVKAGTMVFFKNTDSKPHWPASNPHPTHTDLPGFDANKGLKTGDVYSFVFKNVGTWKFHDHLVPTLHGSVTVQ